MVYDQSWGDGYPEQVAGAVYDSPSFTETVDLGPAQPLQGGGVGGFRPHHGVLLVFLFAAIGLLVLSWLFKSHNLG